MHVRWEILFLQAVTPSMHAHALSTFTQGIRGGRSSLRKDSSRSDNVIKLCNARPHRNSAEPDLGNCVQVRWEIVNRNVNFFCKLSPG